MPNIVELFSQLQQMDEDLIEFEFEDQAQLVNDTKEKITAYYEVRQRLLAESEQTALRAAQLKEKNEKIERQIARLDEYLKMACKAHGVTEFPGNGVHMKVISQRRVRPKFEPSDEFNFKYPAYCRAETTVKYKWDRDALITHFKQGEELAKELAEEYTTEFVRFKL